MITDVQRNREQSLELSIAEPLRKKAASERVLERPSSLAREICAFGGLNAFEEDGDALAYADAHGAEGVFSGGAQELVHRSGDEARAAGAEGVAESNCATVGIYVGRVVGHAEFAENGEGLRGEGFV